VLVEVLNVPETAADAELQYALAAAGEPRPADDTPRWTTAGYFTAGTARLGRVGGGPRVWLRGRRVARVPQRLASDWTYAGPVDLDPVPAPLSFAAQVLNGGDVRLAWAPGAAGVETELYLARGAAPAAWTPLLREATAPEGVNEHYLFHLEPGADYAAAARHVDTAGAAGPFVVTLFTTPSENLERAPRPAGIAVIIGGTP
jgi:hypothetical protein